LPKGGYDKVPVRFIIYKIPLEEHKNRVNKIDKRLKQAKDKRISESYKKELAYSIYITNIPKEVINGKIIGTLYKYRWEL
jgi:hypothetical protein